MTETVRLSISLDSRLAEELDGLVLRGSCGNRSEFVRDLVRERLVEELWDKGSEVLGTLTLVYDHRKPRLGEKLTALQHEHHANVLASTHVHLDHDTCAEMIFVRGRADLLRTLADGMRSLKGVLHAALSISPSRSLTESSHAHP